MTHDLVFINGKHYPKSELTQTAVDLAAVNGVTVPHIPVIVWIVYHGGTTKIDTLVERHPHVKVV